MSTRTRARTLAVGVLATWAAVAALNACDETGPPPPPPPRIAEPESALVSQPMWLPVTTASRAALSLNAEPASNGGSANVGAAERIVYVSLPSGAYPAGTTAIIRNTSAAPSFAQRMLDGGFDPIAIGAGVGDTIAITIQAGPLVLATLARAVPRARRPGVVRTNPPKGKRDVALNSRVTVIFTEPIAASTVTASSVALSRSGTPIPGSIHVFAGGLAVEFIPSVPLVPNATHRLLVTTDIRDPDGDALEADVTVEFTTGATTTPPVTSIDVAPSDATLEMGDAVGDSVQLAATVRSAQGVVTDREVIWSTSDPTVAVVSSRGLVKARAPGLATITATSEGQADSASVTVVPIPVTRVDIRPTERTIEVGGTGFLAAAVFDRNNRVLTRRALVWESDDAGVATVDQRGLVTGIAAGSARITAMSEGVFGTATIRVGVPLMMSRIDIDPPATAVPIGSSVQLTARTYRCNPDLASCSEVAGQPVTWSSADSAVATIDQTGRLTAITAGAAAITAAVDELESTAPVTVLPSAPVTFNSISPGYYFTCGLTPVGKAYCWGQNPSGELGIGVHTPLSEWTPTAVGPVAVSGNLTFASISVGGWHVCGLTTDGSVYCWGLSNFKQVGQSSASDIQSCEFGPQSYAPCATAPTRVTGVPAFRALYAGGLLTCALTPDGTAYCWGGDRYGQLGDGGGVTAHGLPPTRVATTLTFASLSAGFRHVCGLTTDGKAYCWGWNYRGQLGDGSNVNRDVPVAVAGELTFTSLSAFAYHSCGLTTTGQVYCWGDNYYGQLGDGSQLGRNIPAAVQGGPFTSVVAAEFHTCGLAPSGAAYCWGGNWSGELGSGAGASQSTPVPVAGGHTFTTMTSGASHTCGLTSTQVAYCWGLNQAGQLGDGSATRRNTPARVAGQPQ